MLLVIIINEKRDENLLFFQFARNSAIVCRCA